MLLFMFTPHIYITSTPKATRATKRDFSLSGWRNPTCLQYHFPERNHTYMASYWWQVSNNFQKHSGCFQRCIAAAQRRQCNVGGQTLNATGICTSSLTINASPDLHNVTIACCSENSPSPCDDLAAIPYDYKGIAVINISKLRLWCSLNSAVLHVKHYT